VINIVYDTPVLHQLEGFVAIASAGSVSKAADALHLTQPAMSARLRALERQLGTELVVRTPGGVRLTAAGVAFLPHARRALDAFAEGKRLVASLVDGVEGHLTIATTPSISTYVLPGMLKRFRAAYPNVQVAVRTGHPSEVLELVLREEVHLGLACDLEHDEIQTTALYDDELVLVMAPEHPCTASEELTLAQLAEVQLVMFRASSFLDLLTNLFRRAGVRASAVMEVDNIDAAKKMVEHGLGIALLPWIAVHEELAAGTLTTRPIAEVGRLPRKILATRRRDAGPAIGAVANFLATPIEIGR
jgi:DNA-binding transcriptional LysR family regulator